MSQSASTGTWIVVPTYNERDNVAAFVDAVLEVVRDGQVLIVDDNSPDGTGILADALAAADQRVSVLHREEKAGLGAAYRAGFVEALRHPECLRVVQMDCDFSHAPQDLPRLLQALEAGSQLVLGSRYVPGGSTPGWSLRRRLISRVGSLVARGVLLLPYHDLTGGFKAWRRETLAEIDLESGYAQGYGFQVEMTWLAHRSGARITEVPITFRDRVAGMSKMSGAIALEALLMVIRLRASTIRGRKTSARRSPT
ncbi:MAG: polyprenol monophosphomannose synthase [Chloroflexi bacterium]|nr:MAG: polyprenol monophosphomannose synthase [Chloroflexota bacterium]